MGRLPSSYRTTTVHWGKSQADIMRLLSKQGILDTRFTMLESRQEVICEFNYPCELEGKKVQLGVRIQVPLPGQGRMRDGDRIKNQAHRALFYYLKTKFEALQFGLVEFIQEFLPHLTIMDKSGRQATVYQMVGEKLKHGYITGTQAGVKLLENLPKETES